MKNLIYGTLIVLLCTSMSIAQNRTLPSVDVKTLKGDALNIQKVENKKNPIVISFWATWCKPCKKELNNIAEVYEEWQDATGVKLIAISIDDTRTMSKVAPYVNSSDWDYEVYLDPNGDLTRALSIGRNVPHTFLLNKEKEIVWYHQGYMEGDEDKLLEEIKKIAN